MLDENKKGVAKNATKIVLESIIASCLLIMSFTAKSATVNCIGMEKQLVGGKTWNLIFDLETKKFIINGDVIKLDYWKQIKKGLIIYTVNFRDENNHLVYDSLFVKEDDSAYLLQHSVATNKLIAGIEMACHKEGF
jgi:hypothetical protein